MGKYKVFSICLPEDLVEWLDEKARSEYRSRNQIIKFILERARAEAEGERPAAPASAPSPTPTTLRLRRAY